MSFQNKIKTSTNWAKVWSTVYNESLKFYNSFKQRLSWIIKINKEIYQINISSDHI